MSGKCSDSGPVPPLSLTCRSAGTRFRHGPTSSAGGDLVVIANCPSCGTHYKHEPPKMRVRARCGRCDAELDLARLSPYRIVSLAASVSDPAGPPARQHAMVADHPSPATTNERIVARPEQDSRAVRPQDIWEDDDPLPQIPEMTLPGDLGFSEPRASDEGILDDRRGEAPGRQAPRNATTAGSWPAGERAATFALWLATGAIAGTGTSWTMAGSTMTGLAAGAALGGVVGWGWLRWASPK